MCFLVLEKALVSFSEKVWASGKKATVNPWLPLAQRKQNGGVQKTNHFWTSVIGAAILKRSTINFPFA